jgi:hypothetical protein
MAEPVVIEEEPLSPEPPREPRTNIVANVLSIVGFLILIVIIIWGLIHLVGLSQGWFTSIFQGSSSKIELTAPSDAVSGEPLVISWTYSPSEKGTYTFLYQCQSGFQFQMQAADSSGGIPCGAAFSIGTTTTSVTVTPRLSGASNVSVPVSIIFIPTDKAHANTEGSATIIIHPSISTPATTTPTKTNTSTTTPKTTPKTTTKTPTTYRYTTTPTKTTGPADLSVRIIAIGMIDPVSGAFINRLPTSPNEMAAVQFDIANLGGSSSGTWFFQAQLPTFQPYTYVSPPQYSLHPGDHIVNTLKFTQLVPGNFTVIVDPNNSVREITKSNNVASQWIGAGEVYPQPYVY